MRTTGIDADLSGFLERDLMQRVPLSRHAVLLSTDGLMTACTSDVDRKLGEKIAAVASGMQSLSRTSSEFATGDPASKWEQTFVQFADGFLVLMAAGDGSHLAVAAAKDVDLLDLSYRMEKTVQGCKAILGQAPRQVTAGDA
ncbi:roadblock/LC7 domain-containing protein [Streptomyces sp. IB2014 016-6]|uniref:roadblock/LC7 domain-containing protein n=1 Tax=Streptomyces sp. IB2014 016-6 TaxID=2517818 RepID=UPI0011C8569F|nr:roadblock/LC7 domain-containing protein [Streptomyces sp. IB2014 016-6]TXL83957.1 roadblock/LC7 domain-containing protein [Streptomyces sp. IB2014 016-6]